MRVLAIFTIAFMALVAAERDWRKIFSNDRKVDLFDGHPTPHKPSTRLTNGNEVVPHSRPWQVAIFRNGSFSCGGSLIDEQNVLTAANCLAGAIGEIEVVLGAHNIREDEATQVSISSRDYFSHKEFYQRYLLNDIGLIRLPSPVTLNENIQAIPLDNSSCSDDYAGRDANVSGWGCDWAYECDDYDVDFYPVLREVTLEVISNKECETVYGNFVIQPTNICTSVVHGTSTWYGDFGGALVLDGYQIGIASFSSAYGYPAAYTRVCQFSSWIEQNKTQ